MKNLKITFFAIASLISATVSAADIYVRDMGAGGAHATISAAITAAADGDRIIIKPKVGGIPYLENLTIDKTLTFVSETANARFFVQGTVNVTPAVGRTITINNLQLTGAFSTTTNSPAGGRTTVNIANSTFSSTLDAGYNNTTLNLTGSTVAGITNFVHGKITANVLASMTIVVDSGSNLATTDIFILANKIGYTVVSASYPFKISNNFITNNSTGYDALRINDTKIGSTNTIQNNYILNVGNSYLEASVKVFSNNVSIISIINNILCNNAITDYNEIRNNSSNCSVYAFYNLTSANKGFNTFNVLSQASNSSSSVTVNTATATITGTEHVNAGYPEPEYQDLDLTLNDVGPYGGSDSWTNYWPTNTTGKPQVFFLDTPRRVYPGTTTIDASGMGYAK